MKKYLNVLLIALFMCTVLFVTISCSQGQTQATKVTVTFDTQGGSKLNPVSANPGTVVTAPSNPTKNNYVFMGWFDDKEGTKEHDFTAKVDADITIYAVWLDKTSYEKSVLVLPAGTKAVVPSTWSSDASGWTSANGKTDLPGFVTDGSETNVTDELKAALSSVTQDFFATTPKNVIVMISDGMGMSHLKLSRVYKGELVMDLLPYFTESLTDSYRKINDATDANRLDKITTDSCAGGTQILAGYKTRYGYISCDIDGNPVKNLSELAKEKGWMTACVTNDWVSDATPADTIGHATAREVGDLLAFQAIIKNTPDFMMGGGSMSTFFDDDAKWSAILLEAENSAIDDCLKKEFEDDELSAVTGLRAGADGKNIAPIAFYEKLNTAQRAKYERYSVYYYIWKTDTNKSVNFITWAKGTGLATYCATLDANYGKVSEHIRRERTFKPLINTLDFSKPVFDLWEGLGGNDYDNNKPNRGYLLKSSKVPNFCEMVSYTLYQMDQMADKANTGFFAMIENTCTDGWGHAQKPIDSMSEVQCFDEGVAIAVKYVLEHPDTLLVVTADHETGGYTAMPGWENNISKIKSTTEGHSSQPVPCIAFGAGADRFSETAIAAAYSAVSEVDSTKNYWSENILLHEGWITGQIIGELMGDNTFGQRGNYPN